LSDNQPLVINGWRIYAHSLFLNQLSKLTNQVERLKQKNPQNYQQKNQTKRLAAINKLAFEIIPQDPTRKEYRQGNTLGSEYKHWFRAKFFQQYSKRAYESKTDAYRLFKKMLKSGNPPDDWKALLEHAQKITE